MSLLAPLYALGALAIALPILFHLIRRQVKQRTPISSTMFLPETRPPLRNRNRVENWPLLLLRALALLLLALAFSRPFLRSTSLESTEGAARRVVVLVDTSASMRRGDLWRQAITEFRSVTTGLNPGDSLAVVSFDSSPTVRVDFESSRELPIDALRGLGETLFADELPTWNETDLGAALRAAAELAVEGEGNAAPQTDDAEEAEPRSAIGRTQVVVISDLPIGAKLETLQGYAWPRDLPVELRRVADQELGNAWISLPQAALDEVAVEPVGEEADGSPSPEAFRLRVTNSASSRQAQFRLHWVDAEGSRIAAPAREIQVPPGQSIAVRLPVPPQDAMGIELSGDDQDFDNVRYFANRPPRPQTVWYLGPEIAEPRDSPLHYLRQLSLDTPTRRVSIAHHRSGSDSASTAGATRPPEDRPGTASDNGPTVVATGPFEVPDPKAAPLVIASGTLDTGMLQPLLRYVRAGGRLVYLLPPAEGGDDSAARWLASLWDRDPVQVTEAAVRDYAMWSRIDFAHPLFAPLAGPEFNDFSRIRFWAYRKITGLPADARIVVAFDDGSPALIERIEGQGRIWLFASGWQPTESQLGLSTKFVPLIFGLLDADRPTTGASERLRVGDRLLTENLPVEESQIRIDRMTSPAEPLGTLGELAGFDRPGVYRLRWDEDEERVAVNLAETESRIEPLQADEFERLGITLGSSATTAATETTERQLRDVELESQQTLWRWFLIGVLGLLGLESVVGGWVARSRVVTSG